MKITVICVLVIFHIVFITGANFSDDDYLDDFFRDELDEEIVRSIRIRRSDSGGRKKRDAEISQTNNNDKKKKNRRSCCGENDDLKLLWGEGVKELKRECFDQARKATEITKKARMVEEYEGFIHGNKTKDEYTCAVQCIGQKQEVLDHMGNVMKEKMEEYIKNTYSSEPWKAEVADTVMDKCFTETQKPSEGQVSTDNGAVTNGRSIQAKCNSNGISFIHCLWREMQLNCPADKIRESRKCNRLRERLRIRQSSDKDGASRSIF